MPVAIRTLTLSGLILALLSLPLFARMPNPLNNPLLQEIHEASHALLFFGVGGLLLQLVRWRTRWHPWRCIVVVVLTCLILGAAIEWVQPLLGRHRTWLDMERNALGVAAACGVFFALQSGTYPRYRILAVALAVLALAWSGKHVFPWLKAQYHRNSQFPLIMDFDQAALLSYMESVAGAKIRVVPAPDEWDEGRNRAARVVMPAEAQWPGIRIFNPYPDWSDHRVLKFDVYVQDKAADIAVNIYTAQQDRKPWVYKQLSLKEGTNRLEVSLPSSSGTTAAVTDFLIYSKSKGRDITVLLDNLRLE